MQYIYIYRMSCGYECTNENNICESGHQRLRGVRDDQTCEKEEKCNIVEER